MVGSVEQPQLASVKAALAANSEAECKSRIDLRSDTVTQPTLEMRAAMALAEVGDDVFGDDPTVISLEREAAALFQKDAAIFVPSGTMANLIAIMVHCDSRGSEMILGDKSHIHIYEQGGCSQIAAVHPRALPNLPDGTIDLSAVEDAVREPNDHFPTTRLLCLENTHNKCGGRVLTRDYMRRAAETARAHGLVLHLDGARVVNAAVALGETPAAMVEHADSASVCLSKGLGALHWLGAAGQRRVRPQGSPGAQGAGRRDEAGRVHRRGGALRPRRRAMPAEDGPRQRKAPCGRAV
uniref:Threonine aldolase n=1 Tax=Tetraselmis sp. GSL018 TaxID=582737 RepID=A0A061RUN0_9CHLO